MYVFDAAMSKRLEAPPSGPNSRCRIYYTSMDDGISFNDDVMLDDVKHEKKLDFLLEQWQTMHGKE